MAGNTIGNLFKLTTFGESHGDSIGGIIDGCPSNVKLDYELIYSDLKRRSPKSSFETSRKEEDTIEVLSGILNGYTLGTPIAFRILNKDKKSEDYDCLKDVFRPSHADRVYSEKYGIRDYRGGGRSSGRETAARVVAGSIAKQILTTYNIQIQAFVIGIGEISLQKEYSALDLSIAYENEVACPDKETAENMIRYLSQIKKEKDSVGGIIQCVIKNCPVGLGNPVFDRLSSDLSKAMLSIGSVKGFEFGAGFKSATMRGSEYIDLFENDFRTTTNHSGGIQGGISTEEDIYFSVAFHPIVSIQKPVKVISGNGKNIEMELGGRHDVCHVPRVVPVVESMAAITILDHLLCHNAYKK